jgi:hypothetical protein
MSPEQEIALSNLVERQLTINEKTAIDPLLVPNNRNDVEIANILSIGRTKLVSKKIGRGDVLSTIGFSAGNAILDEIDTNPIYRHIKPDLDRSDLDISSPLARQTLDTIATNALVIGFNQVHADAIKALALIPDPINFNKVSDALNIAEKRLVL